MKQLLIAYVFCLLIVACKREQYAGEYRDVCRTNLIKIDEAKRFWALEQKKTPRDVVAMTDIAGNSMAFIKTIPLCPTGGKYTLLTVGEKTTCSVEGHNR